MDNPISEAIKILTADAASLRESHTPPCDRDDWSGDPETKAYYDRLVSIADALSRLRAPVADPYPARLLHERDNSLAERVDSWHQRNPVAALASAPAASTAQHPDDAAVDRFATAMKAKLAAKRADGRGGWEDRGKCAASFLSELLRGHVEKGDPLDVGNFAMMLHQRGDRIAPVAGEAQPVGYIHPDTLAQLAFPMTPYREVPLYRVHRPHVEFDAKRPAGLVPIYTAPPAAPQASADAGQALFWYRPRSDGGYEGPIHNDHIEETRKLSGAWVPLVAAHQANAPSCSCPSGDGSLRWPCAAHPQEDGDAHE